MTRRQQNDWFRDAFIALLQSTKEQGLPIRGGEWNRPSILAKIYSTGIDLWNRGVQLVWPKVGVLQSDHLVSLAVDIWITDETGYDILWKDSRYEVLGAFWIAKGGYWDAKDPYHFELKGRPA